MMHCLFVGWHCNPSILYDCRFVVVSREGRPVDIGMVLIDI